MSPEEERAVTQVVAQLRHAYTHLRAGRVVAQQEFADGLLAPQIEKLERLVAQRPAQAREDPHSALNVEWRASRARQGRPVAVDATLASAKYESRGLKPRRNKQ